jgi:hypothetical protein
MIVMTNSRNQAQAEVSGKGFKENPLISKLRVVVAERKPAGWNKEGGVDLTNSGKKTLKRKRTGEEDDSEYYDDDDAAYGEEGEANDNSQDYGEERGEDYEENDENENRYGLRGRRKR